MTGLKALFIWIGIPIMLMRYFELEGILWTFILGGVFGFIAMIYYGFTTAKENGISLGADTDNLNNIKSLNVSADNIINKHTEMSLHLIDDTFLEHAEEIIQNYYLHETNGTLTKEEAAIIKLSVIQYYILKEEIKGFDDDTVQDSISKLRQSFNDFIRPEISFAARANMGL